MVTRPYALGLAALALGILTLVAFAPATHADFIAYDDVDYIQQNPHVTGGLTAKSVRWAFTRYHSSNWHPLTWLSHMADVELFGLDGPRHHWVNVGFHLLNVLLLFLLLAWVTGDVGCSFVVAALFAVHPVNVESVAWVSQRKTLLSTFLAILTLASYAQYARTSSRWMYSASLLCFVLSLMSKQMMVIMPFALLLFDYWPLAREALQPRTGALPTAASIIRGWWQLSREKIPYLLLALAAGAVTLFTQQTAMNSIEKYPLDMRLGNVAIAYVRYLGSLLWPAGYSVFYPLYHNDITAARSIGALCLLAALTVAAVWFGRRRRYLLFGWFWYLLTMAPVIGVVQVGSQSMADRYAYVPFWGLLIAVVWGAADLLRNLLPSAVARRTMLVVAAGVLLTLTTLTYRQAGTWSDTITLFEAAAANVPRNWKAHRVLADQYLGNGEYQRAIEHCELGIQLGRENDKLFSTYGRALFELGRRKEALEALEQAVALDPQDSLSHANLGWVYCQIGQYESARRELAAAAETLEPEALPHAKVTVYANWGMALAQLERLSEALEKFKLALAADPDSVPLLSDTAALEWTLGHRSDAVKHLRRAATLEPANPRVRMMLERATSPDNR